MLKYNILTSHKQGNRIANRAQLSEHRSENMYQRRLKRVWKMVCFSPNWSRICIIGRHAPPKISRSTPRGGSLEQETLRVQRGLSMS